jgi:AraC family transcriptional regulator, transcriptional activator of pobA
MHLAHGYLKLPTNLFIQQSQLFLTAEPPVFNLTVEQFKFFNCLFQKMETKNRSSYRFKDHLIQNQICVLLHSAIHMQPAKVYTKGKLLVGMSVARYVELAEMKFPAEAQLLYFN